MRWIMACFLLLATVASAHAQEDKDRITRYLQDALSGLGRDVQIEGFRGALSSRATMDRLTIADETGVWLTLTDAVLDWNRASVLRGEIDINELTAARIDLPRLGVSGGDAASPAAGTFALPELPVSLRIASIKADRVVIGAPVVGVPATLTVAGSVSLIGGQGDAKLEIKRIEGPRGDFNLTAAFNNTSRVLGIDLSLSEAANGLSATLLDLPGKPSLDLTVKGEGPLDSFAADIALRSDGQDRLAGRISTQAAETGSDAQSPNRVINADLSGDLTALLLTQYQDFFGPDIALQSRVSLFDDGRISLDNLNLTAASLRLSGEMKLSADRLPQTFQLDAVLADPGGDYVLLPLSGAETRVRGATITAGFDASRGDAWTLSGNVQDLLRDEVRLRRLDLDTKGTISRGEARQVTALIEASATGIGLGDPALDKALGQEVTLGANIVWRDGELVDVTAFDLGAPGLTLSGSGTVDGLDSAIEIDGELSAQIDDLARFDALAGQPLTGGIDSDLVGKIALLTGAFDMDLSATGRDLGLGVPEIDTALAGDSTLRIAAVRDTQGLRLDRLDVLAGPLSVNGTVALSADWLPQTFRLNAGLQSADGSPVLLPLIESETRVGQAAITAAYDAAQGDAWTLTGDLRALTRTEVTMDRLVLDAKGTISQGETRNVSARIDSSATGLALRDPALASAFGREVRFGSDIRWRDGQPIDFSDLRLAAPGMTLTGAGSVDPRNNDLSVQGAIMAQIENLSRLAQLSGQPLRGGITAELVGEATLGTKAFDLVLSATGRDLKVGVPQADEILVGTSRLDISANGTPEAVTLRGFDLVASGATAKATGRVQSGNSDVTFSGSLKQTARFYDALNGATTLNGRAQEDGAGWRVTLAAQAPRAVILNATLTLPKAGEPDARFDVSIPSLAWVAPELVGPARLAGTARRAGSQWALDVNAQGPGGTNVAVAGQIAQSAQSAALSINGGASLGLLNRRLAPNSMQGLAQFDLRLDGALAVSSISGQIRVNDARLAIPSLRNALSGINATVSLNGRSAQIDVGANVSTGGQVTARGSVGMQAPYVTEIALQLANVRISDPKLYETGINGALRVSGSLPSNLSVLGDVMLDRTEILVPSTGIGAFGDVPDITHVNEPAGVRQTRSYAGLLDVTAAADGGGGTAIALDVRINAENRIFVRGRGLDAELGGSVRLMGTTADVVAQGQFGLIRGRLDILGKRLTLEEGSARLQGSLIPALRLVARTTSDDTVILVIVEGPADAPEIRFESQPELPQDEVLALLLFGRGIESISALQAVQLASAVATLAGKGGTGLVERIRQKTGFDDLDVTSNAEGTTSLRAGKYIGENLYSDVVIDSNGKSQINLNLDLSPSTKLRGEVSSDGSTGIGIFFERDY